MNKISTSPNSRKMLLSWRPPQKPVRSKRPGRRNKWWPFRTWCNNTASLWQNWRQSGNRSGWGKRNKSTGRAVRIPSTTETDSQNLLRHKWVQRGKYFIKKWFSTSVATRTGEDDPSYYESPSRSMQGPVSHTNCRTNFGNFWLVDVRRHTVNDG